MIIFLSAKYFSRKVKCIFDEHINDEPYYISKYSLALLLNYILKYMASVSQINIHARLRQVRICVGVDYLSFVMFGCIIIYREIRAMVLSY